MPAEQENARQIEFEITGVTDTTKVGDLTVRQFVELIVRVYEQLPVRRNPPDEQTVHEAITEIRRQLESPDEAFQRVQAAILSEIPGIAGGGGTHVRMDGGSAPQAGQPTDPGTRVRASGDE